MIEFFYFPLTISLYFSCMAYVCLIHQKHDYIGTGCLMGLVCVIFSFTQLLAVGNMNTIYLNDRVFVWGKFLEWCLATPLLCSMQLMGYEADPVTTYQLSLYSLFFCLSGLGAALITTQWIKALLILQGTLCSLIVIQGLWRESKNPHKQSSSATFYLWMTVLTWPMFLCGWCLGPDVFGFIDNRTEFIVETFLSLFLKTVGLVCFALSDEEYRKFSTQVWEAPGNIFHIVRSVLINLLLNQHR